MKTGASIPASCGVGQSARVRRRAGRDAEQARVPHQGRQLDIRQVHPWQQVVREPVRVRELDRPQRAGEPHVALERVRDDVVQRSHPRLHPEPSDEPGLTRDVNREPRVDRPLRVEGDPVDPAVDAVGPERLLGGDALHLRVEDGLEIRPTEHRRREPGRDNEHGPGRDAAVLREYRGHGPGGHQRPDQRTERERLDRSSRRARHDGHALGLPRSPASAKMAGGARRSHVHGPEPVDRIEELLEDRVPRAKRTLLLDRRAGQRDIRSPRRWREPHARAAPVRVRGTGAASAGGQQQCDECTGTNHDLTIQSNRGQCWRLPARARGRRCRCAQVPSRATMEVSKTVTMTRKK